MSRFNDFPQLVYGFSNRKHGNMSPLRDNPDAVKENQKNFLSEFGIPAEKTVKCRLSHSANIKIVTRKEGGFGILQNTSPLPDTDGLITAERGVFLFMVTADCVPVLLFDPVKSVAALLHAGWKGTLNTIAQKGVQLMEKEFGCNPQKIISLLGPAICVDCYQIGDDLADQFEKKFSSHANQILNRINGRFHLDLRQTNVIQLKEAGLSEDNIHIENICTKCNPKEYYSARGEGIETGRFASVIGYSQHNRQLYCE